MERKWFCVKTLGLGGKGTSAMVVNSLSDVCCRRTVLHYLKTKSSGKGYEQLCSVNAESAMNQMEVAPIEESEFANLKITSSFNGVHLEYWYPPNQQVSRLIFLRQRTYLLDELQQMREASGRERFRQLLEELCHLLISKDTVGTFMEVVQKNAAELSTYPEIVEALERAGCWSDYRAPSAAAS